MVLRRKISARKLLQDVTLLKTIGNLNTEISGICYDTRRIRKGDLFFCFKGVNVDGHDFAEEAIEHGAAGLVTEKELEINSNFQVVVENSRQVMALSASRFFDFPSKKLKVIGVTGTNGKTTTVFMIENILRNAGRKTGLIGTVEYRILKNSIPVTHTTPESLELQELFYFMVESAVEDVVMEVSSHAIDQRRIAGTEFDILVFTNLSQDHLDYHGTLENYKKAKSSLFFENRKIPWVINVDDEAGKEIVSTGREMEVDVITYSLEGDATVTGEILNMSIKGTELLIIRPDGEVSVNLPLIGHFNAYNALASASVAFLAGVNAEETAYGLSTVKQVPGRFEVIDAGQDFLTVVDYAHTPDSLRKVLESAKSLLNKNGRLITVFGCGGDRDREKRPKMGFIAANNSDLVIMTSDNPRSEEPEKIIKEIEAGIPISDIHKVKVEVDRKTAIGKAIELASSGDIVLVAGKGHETYQIFKDKTIHFDDREEIRNYLESRKPVI